MSIHAIVSKASQTRGENLRLILSQLPNNYFVEPPQHIRELAYCSLVHSQVECAASP